MVFMKDKKSWFLYILRCNDNSLYTGITTDVDRRIKEHTEKKGAKYTASKGVSKLEMVLEFENRSQATKEEIKIKKLSKLKKETFILNFKYNYNKFE